MALSDYYSAAASAAATATERENARLRAVAEQNQLASNAVQQQLMQQRLLNQTGAGVKPRSTVPTTNPSLPDVQPVGGPVTDRTIKSAPAPMPAAGLRTGPSGAAIAPNMQAAISAVPANVPPLKAAPTPAPAPALTPAAPSTRSEGAQFISDITGNMQMQGDIKPRVNKIGDTLFKTADPFGTGGLANWMFGSKEQGAANAEMQDAARWYNSGAAGDYFMANPDKLAEAESNPVEFYKALTASTAVAPAAAQPTTAAEQPAAATAGVTPPTTITGTGDTIVNQAAAAVGLEPPGPAPEPGVPEVLTNPKLRAAIPDAALDYQAQRLAADRQELINLYSRQADQIKASAAAADQRRNAQYDSLMVQAREAATAGNTGYAQTLMNQADALLAQADEAANSVQKSMDDLWLNARETMAANEAEILSNQAVIAEREFSQFNNPSRALAMMEAYGFQGAELEDAGGGKFRMRMPSNEPGQFFYVQDDTGKPASFTKQSFTEYFMSTISEDFRLKAQERKAAADAASLQWARDLQTKNLDAYHEIVKEIMKARATSSDYQDAKEASDGSWIVVPKNPNLPFIKVSPVEENGQIVYKRTEF